MSVTLFEACHNGNSDQVKLLIDEKCNINQLDEQGRSALHYCSDNTNTDCACLLIKDSILNLQDNEGCSALHLACMNGNEIMAKFLCEHGADVELVDNESHSLIHWITVCGHAHLFDILVQYKAPMHTVDIHGAFPIHYASQLCGISVNEDVKIDPEKGLTILHKFIDRKVDIDCMDGQQRTPLMWAASAGAIDALRLLYKYGANQLHVDKDSLTALHCAATRGYTSCIRTLVEQCGCSLEGEDINGCTALFYAVTLNHLDSCKVLLELNSNPNHKDNRGRTPSHCAIVKGNLDCLKYLIQANANIWVKNKRGDCPIHEVINNKVQNEEIFAVIRYIFRLYPKRISIRNEEQRTPLHLAASLGDIDTCEVLIECGARINSLVRTTAGNYLTPYDLARVRGQKTCAEHLVSHHGGQRGNLLANIFARRIQKHYRQHKLGIISLKKPRSQTINNLSDQAVPVPLSKSKNTLLKQAQVCLDNKKFDDRSRAHSLYIHPFIASGSITDENHAQERRRVFAKAKAATTLSNHNDESKPDFSNKIIVQTSNSISTSNKLYDRRKFIVEELHKMKQARMHNHYIVINRSLYKILIENAFNPQNRCSDEIEKYLETLVKAYDAELEAIRKRTRSVPSKQNRRASQLF